MIGLFYCLFRCNSRLRIYVCWCNFAFLLQYNPVLPGLILSETFTFCFTFSWRIYTTNKYTALIGLTNQFIVYIWFQPPNNSSLWLKWRKTSDMKLLSFHPSLHPSFYLWRETTKPIFRIPISGASKRGNKRSAMAFVRLKIHSVTCDAQWFPMC